MRFENLEIYEEMLAYTHVNNIDNSGFTLPCSSLSDQENDIKNIIVFSANLVAYVIDVSSIELNPNTVFARVLHDGRFRSITLTKNGHYGLLVKATLVIHNRNYSPTEMELLSMIKFLKGIK